MGQKPQHRPEPFIILRVPWGRQGSAQLKRADSTCAGGDTAPREGVPGVSEDGRVGVSLIRSVNHFSTIT